MTVAGSANHWGPRPFRLSRDLGGVLDLIELAFGEEAARFRDLRLLARLGPLLLPFEPLLREVWPGLVWEEAGRVVGNVNFARLPYLPRAWLIFNVAVHPDYRRRGIARRLMNLALERVRAAGGEVAVLDVEADNLPARNLYLSLGFELFERLTEYRGRAPAAAPVRSPNIRPWGFRDWVVRRDLSVAGGGLRYLRVMEWQVGALLGALSPADLLFYGRRIRSWVCEVDGRLFGFGRVDRPLFGRRLRVLVWLAPETPEILGQDFLATVIGQARAGRAVTIHVAAGPDRFELPGVWALQTWRRLDRMFKWL